MSRSILLFLLMLSFSSLISCSLLFPDDEDDCAFVFCDSGPFYSDLRVRVTINSENPRVYIEVFQGNIEDEFLFSQEVIDEFTRFNLRADEYYSVKAYYLEGDHTIIAINGKLLSSPTDECDCSYNGGSTNLDVRLGD